MKESDEVLVGRTSVVVFERGPYAKQVGFVAPDGSTFLTVTVPEPKPAELSESGQEIQDSLASDYERYQRRGRWILRLGITAVLVAAAIYARYLWGRL